MGNHFLLVSKSNGFETILSCCSSVDDIMDKVQNLSMDYYKDSHFYVKNMKLNTERQLWLSPVFGLMLSEVESGKIQKAATM